MPMWWWQRVLELRKLPRLKAKKKNNMSSTLVDFSVVSFIGNIMSVRCWDPR